MNTNLHPQPNTDLATNPAATPETQAPRPVWRAPAITRIEIKRTMLLAGSSFDGITGTPL